MATLPFFAYTIAFLFLPAASVMVGAFQDKNDHATLSNIRLLFDHPYVALTAPNGSFTIDGIPPGRHTLKIWHERTKLVERTVDVAAGGAARVDVAVQGR